MTLRQIISTNAFVITTPRRYDKLSTTILRGKGLWPSGVRISKGDDFSGLPVPERVAAVTAQHQALWDECIRENKPMCILEDDAWCLRTDHPALDGAAALTERNVIYFLGATYAYIAGESDGIARLASGMGTHAYVITPESARVLRGIEGIRVVDHITDAAMRAGLTTGFLLVPEIFCQLNAPGDLAGRANFEKRHQGKSGNVVIPADQMLGDAALIQAQMQRTLWLPRPTVQAAERRREDWSIGSDDVSVLSQIVEYLQSRKRDHPLTVLEFGPGRSTEIFLQHDCIVRSFESDRQWAASLSFAPEKKAQLRLSAVPLHPREISTSELSAETGFGYDLAFVDSPSYSRRTGARDRRVTLECALQNAEVVILHDARDKHEQNLLFEAAQSSGRCIRLADTRLGMAVLFKRGSFTL